MFWNHPGANTANTGASRAPPPPPAMMGPSAGTSRGTQRQGVAPASTAVPSAAPSGMHHNRSTSNLPYGGAPYDAMHHSRGPSRGGASSGGTFTSPTNPNPSSAAPSTSAASAAANNTGMASNITSTGATRFAPDVGPSVAAGPQVTAPAGVGAGMTSATTMAAHNMPTTMTGALNMPALPHSAMYSGGGTVSRNDAPALAGAVSAAAISGAQQGMLYSGTRTNFTDVGVAGAAYAFGAASPTAGAPSNSGGGAGANGHLEGNEEEVNQLLRELECSVNSPHVLAVLRDAVEAIEARGLSSFDPFSRDLFLEQRIRDVLTELTRSTNERSLILAVHFIESLLPIAYTSPQAKFTRLCRSLGVVAQCGVDWIAREAQRVFRSMLEYDMACACTDDPPLKAFIPKDLKDSCDVALLQLHGRVQQQPSGNRAQHFSIMLISAAIVEVNPRYLVAPLRSQIIQLASLLSGAQDDRLREAAYECLVAVFRHTTALRHNEIVLECRRVCDESFRILNASQHSESVVVSALNALRALLTSHGLQSIDRQALPQLCVLVTERQRVSKSALVRSTICDLLPLIAPIDIASQPRRSSYVAIIMDPVKNVRDDRDKSRELKDLAAFIESVGYGVFDHTNRTNIESILQRYVTRSETQEACWGVLAAICESLRREEASRATGTASGCGSQGPTAPTTPAAKSFPTSSAAAAAAAASGSSGRRSVRVSPVAQSSSVAPFPTRDSQSATATAGDGPATSPSPLATPSSPSLSSSATFEDFIRTRCLDNLDKAAVSVNLVSYLERIQAVNPRLKKDVQAHLDTLVDLTLRGSTVATDRLANTYGIWYSAANLTGPPHGPGNVSTSLGTAMSQMPSSQFLSASDLPAAGGSMTSAPGFAGSVAGDGRSGRTPLAAASAVPHFPSSGGGAGGSSAAGGGGAAGVSRFARYFRPADAPQAPNMTWRGGAVSSASGAAPHGIATASAQDPRSTNGSFTNLPGMDHVEPGRHGYTVSPIPGTATSHLWNAGSASPISMASGGVSSPAGASPGTAATASSPVQGDLTVALNLFAKRHVASVQQLDEVKTIIIPFQRHADTRVRRQSSLTIVSCLADWVRYTKENKTSSYSTRVTDMLEAYIKNAQLEVDPSCELEMIALIANAPCLRPFLTDQRLLILLLSFMDGGPSVREKAVELLVACTQETSPTNAVASVQQSLNVIIEACVVCLEYTADTRTLVRSLTDLQTFTRLGAKPLTSHLSRIFYAIRKRVNTASSQDVVVLLSILKTLNAIFLAIAKTEKNVLQYQDEVAELYPSVVMVLKEASSPTLGHAAAQVLALMFRIGAGPRHPDAIRLLDLISNVAALYTTASATREEQVSMLNLLGQLGALDPSTKPSLATTRKNDESNLQDEADLDLTFDYTVIAYRTLSRMLDTTLSDTVSIQALRTMLKFIRFTQDKKDAIGGVHAVRAVLQVAKRSFDNPALCVECLHVLAAITAMRHERVARMVLPEIVVLLEQLWTPADHPLFRGVLEVVSALKPGKLSGKEQSESWAWLYPRLMDVALQDRTESREFCLRVVEIVLNASYIPSHCIPLIVPVLMQFVQQSDQLVEVRGQSLCAAIHIACQLKAVQYVSQILHAISTLTRHCELNEDLGPRLATPGVRESLKVLSALHPTGRAIIKALRDQLENEERGGGGRANGGGSLLYSSGAPTGGSPPSTQATSFNSTFGPSMAGGMMQGTGTGGGGNGGMGMAGGTVTGVPGGGGSGGAYLRRVESDGFSGDDESPLALHAVAPGQSSAAAGGGGGNGVYGTSDISVFMRHVEGGLRLKENKLREWFTELKKYVLLVSPHPAFRMMVDLSDKHEPLRRELFHPSFKSLYEELTAEQIKKVNTVLTVVLNANDSELVNQCLGLADYLDHNPPTLKPHVLEALRNSQNADHKVIYSSESEMLMFRRGGSVTSGGLARGGGVAGVSTMAMPAVSRDSSGQLVSHKLKTGTAIPSAAATTMSAHSQPGEFDGSEGNYTLNSNSPDTFPHARRGDEDGAAAAANRAAVSAAGRSSEDTRSDRAISLSMRASVTTANGGRHRQRSHPSHVAAGVAEGLLSTTAPSSTTDEGENAGLEMMHMLVPRESAIPSAPNILFPTEDIVRAAERTHMSDKAFSYQENRLRAVLEIHRWSRVPRDIIRRVVWPLAWLYRQRDMQDSVVGLFRAVRYEGENTDALGLELLRRWDDAQRVYAKSVTPTAIETMALAPAEGEGYVRTLCFCGEWQTALTVARELCRSPSTAYHSTTVASCGALAAWILGRWDQVRHMADSISASERNSAATRLFFLNSALLHATIEDGTLASAGRLGSGSGSMSAVTAAAAAAVAGGGGGGGGNTGANASAALEGLRRSLVQAKLSLDETLRTLLPISYGHAYEPLAMLQHFTEMEETLDYAQCRSSTYRTQLQDRWRGRFFRLKPDSLEACLRSLMLHALVLNMNELSPMLLHFCDTMGTDYPQLTQWAIRWLSHGVGSTSKVTETGVVDASHISAAAVSALASASSCADVGDLLLGDSAMAAVAGNSNNNSSSANAHSASTSVASAAISDSTAKVLVGFIGYNWRKGDRRGAVQQMETFLKTYGDTLMVQNASVYGNAQLRLGTWKQELHVDSFWKQRYRDEDLYHLHQAIRAIPSSYEAWHSWGLMNYRVQQRDKLSKEELRPFVEAAHQGFVAAIARCQDSNEALPGVMRLLQLWVIHNGVEMLKETVADSISRISVDHWVQVIPQLIGHLGNESHDVREVISMILRLLCEKHPQAVVFPLLVVVMTDDLQCNNRNPQIIHKRQLVQSIIQHIPQRIRTEAEHVAHLLVGVSSIPIEKIRENLSQVATAWNPHAEYEEDLEEVQCRLELALNLFNANRRHLLYTVGDIGQFVQVILEDLQRGDREKAVGIVNQLVDEMSRHISDKLGKEPQKAMEPLLRLRNMSIAVFGTYDITSPEYPTIASFCSRLDVIPSKKRPRRIHLNGSDGCVYSYCLKGNEDIRMDERVMQLFSMVNVLLSHTRVKSSAFIHRFPVIPISSNVGLLGWVENANTVNSTICNYRATVSHVRPHHESSTLRAYVESFGQWDRLSIIQRTEVLDYIMTCENCEAVDVARAMWHRSNAAEQWLDRRTSFTTSLSTMSMVGYVLGLGDRHLGNILLSMSTGKVVHIDFGDSFDVGRLRHVLPETVPFRLTRMLTNAMEVFGVDGIFRASSTRTQRILHKNRDSIMALLSAFLYDPIVQHKGKMKNMMEKSRSPQVVVERVRNKLRGNELAVRDDAIAVYSSTHESARRPDLLFMSKAFDDASTRDEAKSFVTEEQVDFLISEAVRVDNYSTLYFGWGPMW